MTVLSVLALLIWVAVLARGAWLVVHPHRREPVRVSSQALVQH